MRLFNAAEIDAALSCRRSDRRARPGLPLRHRRCRRARTTPSSGPASRRSCWSCRPGAGRRRSDPISAPRSSRSSSATAQRNLPGVMGAYLLMDGETGAAAGGDGRQSPDGLAHGRCLGAGRALHGPSGGQPHADGRRRQSRALPDQGASRRAAARPTSRSGRGGRRRPRPSWTSSRADGIEARAVTDLEGEARAADIISCATNATRAADPRPLAQARRPSRSRRRLHHADARGRCRGAAARPRLRRFRQGDRRGRRYRAGDPRGQLQRRPGRRHPGRPLPRRGRQARIPTAASPCSNRRASRSRIWRPRSTVWERSNAA